MWEGLNLGQLISGEFVEEFEILTRIFWKSGQAKSLFDRKLELCEEIGWNTM